MDYICECGYILKKEIYPDEKSNGVILGYPIWKCNKCGEFYDESEIKCLKNKDTLLDESLLLVEKYFKGKVDKAGKPYINHLIAVSEQVNSEEDKVVAILHDIIEDTDITIEELNEIIPKELIFRILLLTHNKNDTYYGYINNILNSGDIHAIRIKMADIWHNMDLSRLNEIKDKDIKRFQKYRKCYKKLEKKYIQMISNTKQ